MDKPCILAGLLVLSLVGCRDLPLAPDATTTNEAVSSRAEVVDRTRPQVRDPGPPQRGPI